MRELIASIARDVERLPGTEEEFALDAALARAAVGLAVAPPLRHHRDRLYGHRAGYGAARQGPVDVDAVIGTGGAIVSSRDPRAVLATALADAAEPLSLRPRAPRLLVDTHYLLYACGLLGAVEPEAALELALAQPATAR